MGTIRPQVAGIYGGVKIDILQSPLGVPCNTPPFGSMSAIDLNTQKLVWQVPLGTVQDTGPLGIKMGLPMPIGLPTLGGSLATQGGLVFFAGTQDYYLRALDIATGKAWAAVGMGASSRVLLGRVGRVRVLMFSAQKSASIGGVACGTFMPFRRLSLQSHTGNAVFL